MKTKLHFTFLLLFFSVCYSYAQNIGDFTSVTPATQTSSFIIPGSHTFQVLAESGDAITGGTLPNTPDFTGYVPISGSSTNGYLSLNHEIAPGAVTVFDINFNGTSKLWETTASQAIDFSGVGQTAANCSGTVTSWGNIISCEEVSVAIDLNFDGYNDVGWNVEINPATKTVVGKHWAMGNFKHENVAIHSNNRTVYQGADDTSGFGFLYKFVATSAEDLSAGDLYVYSGSKSGSGSWILINDSSNSAHQTATHRNNTNALSDAAGATDFNGIEDVEIGPDGMVYFAVKGAPDQRVYRFQDSDPITGTTVTTMETFVGNMSYDIDDGSSTTSVAWGTGNDNLAFDGEGNLWVLQDGGNHYIWVVENGHTQASPKVKIFGITPSGAEPTGITFTPDYKYLFMSIQHPSGSNTANQVDASGNSYDFELGTTLVVALSGNLGTSLSIDELSANSDYKFYPNPVNFTRELQISGPEIEHIEVFTMQGKKVLDQSYNRVTEVDLDLKQINAGIFLLSINNAEVAKLIIK